MSKSFKERLDDCTYKGKFHYITCWGIAHVLMLLVIMSFALSIHRDALIPSAIVGCLFFIFRESKGSIDSLFSGADRVGDWVAPIIAAIIYIAIAFLVFDV